MKSKSPLDVNELFPDYITKKIFRFFVLLMLVLLIVTAGTNGWTLKFSYMECPVTADKCIVNQTFNPETFQYEYNYLEAGEYIGNKPNSLGQHFNSLVFLLTILAFLINHIYYSLRTGKTSIPFNKKKWEEINENSRKNIKKR